MKLDKLTVPPYPEQVEKVCRYGHGPLQVSPDTFCMETIYKLPADESKVGGKLSKSGDVFVVGLAVCSRCGYTELFDTEPRPSL